MVRGMTCPPSPGVLAYLACVLAMLWANPLALAGLLMSLGAAVSAVLLTRRRSDHRPARILCLVWLADVLGWLLAPALASGGPFTGWLRVLQHLDTARFLVWPMAVQFIVGLTFVDRSMRSQAGKVLLIALPGFYALMLAISVVCYPELRGDVLGRYYACIQANAAVWSLVVGGSWALRAFNSDPLRAATERASEVNWLTPEQLAESDEALERLRSGRAQLIRGADNEPFSPGRVVASLLVALSMLSAIAGPWWRGLFGAFYRGEQVILCVLFGAIIGVQAWALARPPRVACFRAPETLGGDSSPQA